MRNMLKLLEGYGGKSPAPSPYQLTLEEIQALYGMLCNGKAYQAIVSAFDYGFMLGRRCEARERKKKASSAGKG